MSHPDEIQNTSANQVTGFRRFNPTKTRYNAMHVKIRRMSGHHALDAEQVCKACLGQRLEVHVRHGGERVLVSRRNGTKRNNEKIITQKARRGIQIIVQPKMSIALRVNASSKVNVVSLIV